jgi:hypothetical protein
MDESVQITKPQLYAALLKWDQEFQDGKTISPSEAATLPQEARVQASTNALWDSLVGTVE